MKIGVSDFWYELMTSSSAVFWSSVCFSFAINASLFFSYVVAALER